MIVCVSFFPLVIYWNFAIYNPAVPPAYDCTVLFGFHPGKI